MVDIFAREEASSESKMILLEQKESTHGQGQKVKRKKEKRQR